MRKYLFLIIIFFLSNITIQAQAIYKEFVINDVKMNFWVKLYKLEEFDINGNLIHEKYKDDETWYKYDINCNLINRKESYGYNEWYEYDTNNNLIHYKASGKMGANFGLGGPEIQEKMLAAEGIEIINGKLNLIIYGV